MQACQKTVQNHTEMTEMGFRTKFLCVKILEKAFLHWAVLPETFAQTGSYSGNIFERFSVFLWAEFLFHRVVSDPVPRLKIKCNMK